MINHILLSGLLEKAEPGSIERGLTVRRNYKANGNCFISDHFRVVHWSRSSSNKLFSLKEGSYVLIEGRTEIEDGVTYIICETISLISPTEERKNE